MPRKPSNRKHCEGKTRNFQKLVSQKPSPVVDQTPLKRFKELRGEMRNKLYRAIVTSYQDTLIITDINGGFQVYDEPDMMQSLATLHALDPTLERETEAIFYAYNIFAVAFLVATSLNSAVTGQQPPQSSSSIESGI